MNNLPKATQELVQVFLMREAILQTLAQIEQDYEKCQKTFLQEYLALKGLPPEKLVIEASPNNWLLLLVEQEQTASSIIEIQRIAGVINTPPSTETLTPQDELSNRIQERLDKFAAITTK